MNKKIYLSAFLLSTAFAACTQEDVIEMTKQANSNSRVALEDVTFETEAMSRFAFDDEGGKVFNNYTAVKGDAVGAYLIDEVNGTIVSDEDWQMMLDNEALTNLQREQGLLAPYDVVDKIQGSFKWTYDGAKYTPSDVMVEGNYLYIAPYQEKKTREDITTKIDQVQYLKYNEGTKVLNENSLLDALSESGTPVAVGYEFLSRYNNVINGQLRQIYAYPELTFVNAFTSAVKVQKIVLHSSSKFAIEGTINIVGAQTALNRLDSDADNTYAGPWTMSKQNNYYQTTCATADVVTPSKKVGFIAIMAPEDYSVAVGKTMSFRAVIPAAAYSAGDLVADVYTDKGIFRQVLGEVTYNPGLRYSNNNYLNGSLIKNLVDDENTLLDESKNGFDAAVEQDETTNVSPVVVVDTDDLIAVINGAAEGTDVAPNTIAIAPVNTVVINEKVAAALGTKKGLSVSELVNVEGSANGYTLKNVLFQVGAKVTSGKLTLGTGAKVKGTNTLEIAANATVILDEVLNANGNAQIANKGTLNINKVQTVKNLTNEGTLTINKIMVGEVVGEVVLNNFTNGAAATTSAEFVIANGAKAKVTALSGYGDTTINANAIVDLAGESNGDITNNGTFTPSAKFVSNGDFYNYSKLNGADTFWNDGTFYNYYTGGVISIERNGVTDSGDLDDSAEIIPVAKSMTKVYDNFGTIKYVDGALLAETTNHGAQAGTKHRYGHVEYTFEGSDSEALNEAFPSTYATKLVLTKNFEIKKEKAITVEAIKCIEVTGGIITVNENQQLHWCPLFVAGDVTLTGNKAILTNDRVIVDQTAVLTIFGGTFQGYHIDATGAWMSFQNNGTVNNFGKVLGTNAFPNSYQTTTIGTWKSVWEGNDFNEVD